eukprot:2704996-Pleurochrysis_carterae.AAC.1
MHVRGLHARVNAMCTNLDLNERSNERPRVLFRTTIPKDTCASACTEGEGGVHFPRVTSH